MERVLTVVSLSGGTDSFSVAHKALKQNYDVLLINFQYNQKNKVETICSQLIYNYLSKQFSDKVTYNTINLETMLGEYLSLFSQLRDSKVIKEVTQTEFYMPSRNLLFTSILVTIGELIGIQEKYDKVLIGLGVHNHSTIIYKTQYWDITPEFVDKLNELLSQNKNIPISLFTPFVGQEKKSILKYMKENNLPFDITWTCYSPRVARNDTVVIYKPCGECESCLERKSAGKEIGVENINDYVIIDNVNFEEDITCIDD